MPGIVGIITKGPREEAQAEVLRMVEAVRHEAFYVTGTWSDERSGIYVGWTARQGSFSEQNPLVNETGNSVLVFSGEEYSDQGTVTRLQKAGHTVGIHGSSYLVHLSEDDTSFPARLNGRFHGLLVNRDLQTATLFNDRYGMHRVYIHKEKEMFYFAAEAKAILAVRPELRRIDPRSLGEYISCGCVLENRSLFPNVHVLPPASAWIFRNGKLSEEGTYFCPRDWEEQGPLSTEIYYEKLKEVFAANLPRYFTGGQRVGMSLTGGLDSRIIMAWRKAPPGTLPCYSFGGAYRDCQDVMIARRVADACQQPHHLILVGDEFLSRFSRYAERTVYLTDGCVSVKHSPDLYINELARHIAPVRMTGNYGGEVLRHVRAFKPIEPAPGLFDAAMVPHIARAKETYSALLRGHPLSVALFRQAPWHHYGLQALEQTQLSLRSPYLDNDFVRTVFLAPRSAFQSNDLSLQLIRDGDPNLAKIRSDRGLGGTAGYLRSAFLRAWLEFSFKAEYGYDYGMPQWVSSVDHAFSNLKLERLFLGRHKFYHFRVWYRDKLAEYVQEILLDDRTLSRPYVNRKRLEEIVLGHVKRGKNYTSEIHNLLTLEHVHRQFVDAR